jgi:uncharacterized SAM-binding protein YcdF (DUF218 family)
MLFLPTQWPIVSDRMRAESQEMGSDLISSRRPMLARHSSILVLISLALVFGLHFFSGEANLIGNLLMRPLEQRFPRADPAAFEKLSGIIVLTGGDKRLAEAGRLARENPKLPIVIGGAKGMSAVVAELGGGIDSSRVLLETQSNNTYENALYSAEMIKPKRSERWLLVTGASHLPRAIGSFRRAGFEVEPWPIYDQTDSGWLMSTAALHEWLGLFTYWALGRTSALLPSY